MPESTELISKRIAESIAVKNLLLNDAARIGKLGEIGALMVDTYRRGGRVFIAGNGGSAADAQHFAAELVGRFQKERPAIFAVALTTDTSALTSIANDYGFDDVFRRQLEGLGSEGDLFIGITTSGNSTNVLAAFDQARKTGIATAAFTGEGGGKCAEAADILFDAPSTVTTRAQECHILAIHILCEIVEESLFGKD